MDVAFWNDMRLSRLTPFQKEKECCTKKHKDLVVARETEVVYKILVTGDQVYIGQNRQCFEENIIEHKVKTKLECLSSPCIYRKGTILFPSGINVHF